MLDFLNVSATVNSKFQLEIKPDFKVIRTTDLMIRGGDFYAIWDEEKQLWTTDEYEAVRLIDREIDIFRKEHPPAEGQPCIVYHLWDSKNGMIDKWRHYCRNQMFDIYTSLDEQLVFANQEPDKKLYSSKRLSYPLEQGDYKSFDRIMSVLYSPEERHKIEWAIGSIVSGDSKTLQKFMVLYGAAGTGKSTVLNIIQQLFSGYYSVFDAKALGSNSNAFALETFKNNPLVAIQHDGDLSRIEDNTRLNSLVSHEEMPVNTKNKSIYISKFKAFLFMGTNRPVKITDGKSGLLRRLIDVTPTGEKLMPNEYKTLVKNVSYELGAIAYHCLEVYQEDPGYYDGYVPLSMIGASNDFYNYVADHYHIFAKENSTTLKAAWELYKVYCEEAKITYDMPQRVFKEELKNYFLDFKDRVMSEDGSRLRSYYTGFKTSMFDTYIRQPIAKKEESTWIDLKMQISVLDELLKNEPAQYANENETPMYSWDSVKTTLKDIDTSRLHYVRPGESHVVIDFDLKDENGNKSLELNLKEASKWPATYCEVSKGGQGIHLHYIYTGDAKKLANLVKPNVEVKTFTGKSSLRRRLSLCNDLDISTISSGLPLKGDKVVSKTTIEDEAHLRALVNKALNKEIFPNTKPSVDFIHMILEEAYEKGIPYDLSDMLDKTIAFASSSSHNSRYCVDLIFRKTHFKSESEDPGSTEADNDIFVFFDVEVFPNLFLVNYKKQGENESVIRLINPTPNDISELMSYKLVGFNCRRYDNHMLYACLIGYSNKEIYELSKAIIGGDRNAFFGNAYNISYTDVYDFSSKKQSLKKFEIELGIHHQELGLKWDEPVPEHLWETVAEYCDNDVLATEAVFENRKADFTARSILADVAGLTVNHTTNNLTTQIIFRTDKNPQSAFNYRFLGETSDDDEIGFHIDKDGTLMTVNDDHFRFNKNGQPVFPGYLFEKGVSTYRGEEVGEGGYVYAEPGMYTDVALLDIASMHPSSIIAEQSFGELYTKRFQEIRDARIAIKHKEFDKAREMLDGKLAKYLDDESKAADLAQALKIAINSVYGLTSAKFTNAFRDIRNVDNIVAKRGALFMINLKHAVQSMGFTVAHIKTDSIKIPNATPEIIQFVMDFGKAYGYNFEHEATYSKMCLVNDAVYIARYKDGKHAGEWTATGKQFQIPYIFKTLFSHEDLSFADFCETKSASTALYLDMNENLPEGEHNYVFVGKVGQFCPIVSGQGGGILLRENGEKYDSVSGSKGYRWKESEAISSMGWEDLIDISYYEDLAYDAVENISKYGDFEWFVSDSMEPPWFSASTGDEDPWSDDHNAFALR